MNIQLLSQPGMQESLLITKNNRHILIDRCHPAGYKAMRAVLNRLLPKLSPKKIDLLVISNTYDEYAGCIIELVRRKYLFPEIALVSEEQIGVAYPQDEQDCNPECLVIGLEETTTYKEGIEKAPAMGNAAIRSINNHTKIMQTLATAGTKVFRYQADKYYWKKFLQEEFKDFGLVFL